MSVEIIKQYELSILELEKIRQNKIETEKRLINLEKDCDDIKKELKQMREYVKHFKKI